MEETTNKRTCLYDRHVKLGAQISAFGGFDMPMWYTNITEEHNAVRKSCGVFDVSHMGEVKVSGPGAEAFVQHIFTGNISSKSPGQIEYGMMLYPNGGVVDDLLVYVMGENEYFLVINAANIDKDFQWMKDNSDDFDVKLENQSGYYSQLAVQGPQSESIMKEDLGLDVSFLKFYTFICRDFDGETVIISRTGYTGEDGFEIYGSHGFIVRTWDRLMATGKVKPCGLGCRDTLRFEVGLPLYGDELSSEISPLEAGLGFFVDTTKPEFIGKDAVVRQKEDGLRRKIVGLELLDKAIPRHGYEVEKDGKVIGCITTGYRSISTGKSIAMAMIDAPYFSLGTAVEVSIHRKLHKAVVTKKKFYNKNYKK